METASQELKVFSSHVCGISNHGFGKCAFSVGCTYECVYIAWYKVQLSVAHMKQWQQWRWEAVQALDNDN